MEPRICHGAYSTVTAAAFEAGKSFVEKKGIVLGRRGGGEQRRLRCWWWQRCEVEQASSCERKTARTQHEDTLRIRYFVVSHRSHASCVFEYVVASNVRPIYSKLLKRIRALRMLLALAAVCVQFACIVVYVDTRSALHGSKSYQNVTAR